MFPKVLSSQCIFCTSACASKFTARDGKFLQKGQACAQLSDQLNPIFILRNILGMREDKLCQVLGKLVGKFSSKLWLPVCEACEEAVKEFYITRKEYLRLQKKLIVISNELKGHVQETSEVDYKPLNEATAQVWKEVREEVLKEFELNSFASQHNTLPSTEESINDAGMPLLNRTTHLPAQEGQGIAENQYRKKRKLGTNPIHYPPDHDSQSPLVILPSDIVKQEEADENTYNFMSEDIQSDEDDDDDSNDNEEHPDDPLYLNPPLSQSQINPPICSQNQMFNQEEQEIPSISNSIERSYESVSPCRQSELESVRRYPLPTLPFQDCPRFSGVQKGTEREYECLECSAKSSDWKTFKAHLELHHPTSGAVHCGECGWLVQPGKLICHCSRPHP